ncbi:MAG: hypothetical protein KA313_06490 [Pseudarcicella sp.]|nr:hypothetical protein [Pseudarcicella sp.]MBP6410730.1 hypothetical protein [Pseudarcicella sp.]
MKKILLAILIVHSFLTSAQEHYPTQRIFNKNKAKTVKKDWKVMSSQHFEVNFYGKNANTATYTAQLAETAYEKISNTLGFSPYEKTKIFLYEASDYTEGINKDIDSKSLLDDKINDPKLNLIIEGTSKNFQQNLIKNITTLYIHDMLYGGNVKDAIQNSLLLNTPEWFTKGLVAYILNNNDDLNFAQNQLVINYLNANNFSKIDHLKNDEAQAIGQSMWHFIAEKYGKENISGILNLTRIIRNEKVSMSSTLNTPFMTIVKDWKSYYLNKHDQIAQLEKIKNETKINFTNHLLQRNKSNADLKINPKGTSYGLLEYGNNEISLKLIDKQSKKDTILFRNKNNKNIGKPLFKWKNNQSIVLISQTNNINYLQTIDLNNTKSRESKTKEARKMSITGNILSFDINEKTNELVASVEKNGQIDIFIYNIKKETFQQITNDAFDDLEPTFSKKSNDFLFISNRNNDSLNVEKATLKTIDNQQSVFLYEGKKITKKIYTSNGSIANISTNNENEFYFIENSDGINQLKKYTKADSSTKRVWISDKAIAKASYNEATRQLLVQSSHNDYYQLENQSLDNNIELDLKTEQISTQETKTDKPQNKTKSTKSLVLKPGEVDTENYIFEENNINSRVVSKSNWRTNTYSKTKATPKPLKQPNLKVKGPYNFRNSIDLTSTENGFQSDPRGLGYRIDVALNDQLDQYEIDLGGFTTFDLKNIDLYAGFNYNFGPFKVGPRVDRKSLYVGDENLTELRTTNSKYAINSTYVISKNARLALSPYYIYNKVEQINTPVVNESITTYAGIKSEFIFDNSTIGIDNRPKSGNKFLLKYENNKSIKIKNEDFGRFTADFRHYFNLGGDFTFATRFYGQHSFGKSPKTILFGGMDNWISERFSQNFIKENGNILLNEVIENYFLLDFSTNMRGFELGKSNGKNNLLINTELRIPVAKYLFNNDVTSKFLTNLQLATFLDAGAVWTGNINELNTTVLGSETEGSQIIKIKNYKEPYLLGIGFGFRTTVLGNYLKYDLAWGKEFKNFNKPISYFTLGYEF